MLTNDMVEKLNSQLYEELNSSYVYLGLAAELDNHALPGAAAYFKKRADEERQHATKFWNYISDVKGHVALKALPAPALTLKEDMKPVDLLKKAFEITLAHEQYITKCIHELVFLARNQKDLTTENFLQWFVSEQVEEEKQATDYLDKIRIAGGSPSIALFLDKELRKAAKK